MVGEFVYYFELQIVGIIRVCGMPLLDAYNVRGRKVCVY